MAAQTVYLGISAAFTQTQRLQFRQCGQEHVVSMWYTRNITNSYHSENSTGTTLKSWGDVRERNYRNSKLMYPVRPPVPDW